MKPFTKEIRGRLFRLASFAAAAVVLAACSSTVQDDESSSSDEALTKKCSTPSATGIQGRDVSTYQGNFDWNAAKAQGVVFGVARIVYGLNAQDDTFAGNWARMKDAGIIRGGYQWFRPQLSAADQADRVIKAVGKLGDGDLPVTMDLEESGGQSRAQIAAAVKTWLQLVEAGTGKRPIIYTGGYFWQDNVGDTSFGKYPLWIAAYIACPLIPDGWSDWTIWQYSDGAGKLDHDVFNGTLAQLKALAGPVGAPRGAFDIADCTSARGWAQDADTPTKSVSVNVHYTNVYTESVDAADNRPDITPTVGSPNHGFHASTPYSFFDGKPHDIFADVMGTTLGTKTVTCAANPPSTLRRHVTSPDSYNAWGFVDFYDQMPLADDKITAFAPGPDVEQKPVLFNSDDKSPEVWIKDGDLKRHVVSTDSASDWHLDLSKVVTKPAAEVNAMKRGADLPERPLLVRNSKDGAVYLLDDPNGTSAPTPSPGPGSSPGAPSDNDASGGCSVGISASRSTSGMWLALAVGVGLLRRRRLPA